MKWASLATDEDQVSGDTGLKEARLQSQRARRRIPGWVILASASVSSSAHEDGSPSLQGLEKGRHAKCLAPGRCPVNAPDRLSESVNS